MKSKYALNSQQRYALILECRNSGLSDYQWCKEHGIHPGTFYNWVSKLKKKGITLLESNAINISPVEIDYNGVVFKQKNAYHKNGNIAYF